MFKSGPIRKAIEHYDPTSKISVVLPLDRDSASLRGSRRQDIPSEAWVYPHNFGEPELLDGPETTLDAYLYPYTTTAMDPTSKANKRRIRRNKKDKVESLALERQKCLAIITRINRKLADPSIKSDVKEVLRKELAKQELLSKELEEQYNQAVKDRDAAAKNIPTSPAPPLAIQPSNVTQDISLPTYPTFSNYVEVVPKVIEHEGVTKEQLDAASSERNRRMLQAGLAGVVRYGTDFAKLFRKKPAAEAELMKLTSGTVSSRLPDQVNWALQASNLQKLPLEDTSYSQYEKTISSFTQEDLEFLSTIWKFCYNSYRPSAQVPGWNYKWLVYNNENAGFYSWSNNISDPSKRDYVIAFRGTQDAAGIADDISSGTPYFIEPNGIPGISFPVKLGFSYGPGVRIDYLLKTQLNTLIKELVDIGSDINSIVITGHSLGGGCAEAFAVVCAFLFPPDLLARTICVTYEGMRGLTQILFKHMVENRPNFVSFNNRSFRYFHEDDPIPNLPPYKFGFTHFGAKGFKVSKEFSRQIGIEPTLTMIFDANNGPHSMRPTSILLDKAIAEASQHPPSVTTYSYVEGYGRRGGKKRTRKLLSPKEKKLLQAKMAYVRSFKKH